MSAPKIGLPVCLPCEEGRVRFGHASVHARQRARQRARRRAHLWLARYAAMRGRALTRVTREARRGKSSRQPGSEGAKRCRHRSATRTSASEKWPVNHSPPCCPSSRSRLPRCRGTRVWASSSRVSWPRSAWERRAGLEGGGGARVRRSPQVPSGTALGQGQN